ncbi:uncharacterized protein A1O9_06519 [Exophiala aquamarina CBS 119918]|uniref:Uncharacterized protein n=1 Tax=Exophiala aquamarina CBS 119918 TaxID=1182545 RepID=A0A072PH05_9EURO|nr:uncharacterized protein A1O9_06519 [Exophiala aquamarina CBS 119918]KEF58593.1 hypothetical protein A1O9_06519 [Exophiala aquamarina CBS 119918]
MSVQAGDALNKTMGILTQLWGSKNIFRRRDGTIDSLTLRCGGRLAMSASYDCYWWWRWEFAGQAYPYDEENGADISNSQHLDPRVRSADRTGVAGSNRPVSPIPKANDTISFANSGGTDWFNPTATFLEDYWLEEPDLQILDWAPPLVNGPLLPANGAALNEHVVDAWHPSNPQV